MPLHFNRLFPPSVTPSFPIYLSSACAIPSGAFIDPFILHSFLLAFLPKIILNFLISNTSFLLSFPSVLIRRHDIESCHAWSCIMHEVVPCMESCHACTFSGVVES